MVEGNDGELPVVTIVPVLSGSVSVRFVEVAGLSIVKVAVPVAAPAIEIFDKILLLY
jgi:hypothetical protein